MKLLTKTTILYISITLFLFSIGGITFYFQLKNLTDEEITEDLYLTKHIIHDNLKREQRFPENQILFRGKIDYLKTHLDCEILHDTLIFDESEKELLPYRELAFPIRIDSTDYTAKISLPLFESEDLVETISITLLIISILLIAALLILSRFISIKLWKPFFATLNEISRYQINNHDKLYLPSVKTKEFAKLNTTIATMTQKIEENYHQLRAFTENASHEIQTPLASILLETEQLLQSPDLPEDKIKQIHKVHTSALRLGKINESLLLLAKIGNYQYTVSEVNISMILLEKLDSFIDRISLKNISIKTEIEPDIVIHSSPVLTGILISNLLSNAIRHNFPGGNININLTNEELTISNSGKPLPFDQDMLFQRFVRDPEKKDSTGLGLALVKEITENNGWKIQYHYYQEMHFFTLIFR